MQSFVHFVTEFPQPARTAHESQVHPRFSVWEAGSKHPQPEIIATGDNLQELCQFHGLDPRLAMLPVPDCAGSGNDWG